MDVRGTEQRKHWAQFFKDLFSSLLLSDGGQKGAHRTWAQIHHFVDRMENR